MKTYDLYRRRLLSAALIIVLAACFWLVCAGRANAATKTFYVLTSAKTTGVTDADGVPGSTSSEYSYDKNGLLKSDTYYPTSGKAQKIAYDYDKNGLTKKEKGYYEGEKEYVVTYTIKKGKITADKYYYYDASGSKQLSSKSKYVYKKGKLSRIVTTSADDGSISTTYFRSNGTIKKYVSNTTTTKYDKHGYITSTVWDEDENHKGKATYTNTYDKNGRIKEIVEDETSVYWGSTYTTNSTTTYKYTIKSGRVTKCVVKVKSGENESNTMTTYGYKKVKVAKKYWNIVKKQQASIL